MRTKTLCAIPSSLPADEFVEILAQKPGVRIERIISVGQVSPPNFWYDQAETEWVAVLQGEATLQWEDGGMTTMCAGEWLLIPAHLKHRVAETSKEPACVWLAVFM